MPYWLGFIIILVIGVVLIIVGAVGHPVGARYIGWGVWAIISTIIAWISGAVSEPTFTSDDTFGAAVSKIKTVPWIVIAVLFVVLIIFGYVVGPNH